MLDGAPQTRATDTERIKVTHARNIHRRIGTQARRAKLFGFAFGCFRLDVIGQCSFLFLGQGASIDSCIEQCLVRKRRVDAQLRRSDRYVHWVRRC
jgi:hypothetical protein